MPQRGEQHSNAKLDEEKVHRIRELGDLGVPATRISRDYEVSHITIRKVVARLAWAHVPERDVA